jgi:hypothetical protein
MVVLSHEIIAQSPKTKKETVYGSTLIAYGDERETAMARTVGMPVAIAALRVLDGGVKARGVMGPTERSIYESVLEGMEERGLGMQETIMPFDDLARDVTRDWKAKMNMPPTMEMDGVQEGTIPKRGYPTVEMALAVSQLGRL